MEITRFNIRVYGLLIFKGRLLISDEILRGTRISKFPGGGLEYGEGIADCLRREFIEELGQEIEIIRHFYTTDFFVQSAFYDTDQVICVYYLVKTLEAPRFRTSDIKFDFHEIFEGCQSFRWISLTELRESDFIFPTDRAAVRLFNNT